MPEIPPQIPFFPMSLGEHIVKFNPIMNMRGLREI